MTYVATTDFEKDFNKVMDNALIVYLVEQIPKASLLCFFLRCVVIHNKQCLAMSSLCISAQLEPTRSLPQTVVQIIKFSPEHEL